MSRKMTTLVLAAIATAVLAIPAVADDRPATATEEAEISPILGAAGFSTWKKIEFDAIANKFEVVDARHSDGRLYDVDIRDGKIIERDFPLCQAGCRPEICGL